MVKRRIVWTKSAHLERIEILNYWFNKTKSKAYSKKLNKLFSETIKLLCTHPEIGRITKDNSIRITIVRDYLIFYEFYLFGIQEEMKKILNLITSLN
jgi:plasmid stabilization system protein ParE